jgi:hypothetical protein
MQNATLLVLGELMKFVLVFLFTFICIGTASAQYDRLTGNTVFQAIQCDVGRFGVTASKTGIDPKMQAHVVYSWTVEKSAKVTASFGLTAMVDWIVKGPSVETSLTWSRTDGRTIDGNFNINEGNREVCRRGDIPSVPVGIFECLKESTDIIKAKVTARCDMVRILAGKVTANGTFRWIVIQAGASGDFDAKVTYNIKVDAPAKEKKKKSDS